MCACVKLRDTRSLHWVQTSPTKYPNHEMELNVIYATSCNQINQLKRQCSVSTIQLSKICMYI